MKLQKCDRCGNECYDFRQWRGKRTCIICTETLVGIEAALLACIDCLDELPLNELRPGFHHEPQLRWSPSCGVCRAFAIRDRFGLGSGPLEDWYSTANEPKEKATS